ncbi:MAG TPA: hypothetical protein VF796_16840 [Humisphaera sp.]
MTPRTASVALLLAAATIASDGRRATAAAPAAAPAAAAPAAAPRSTAVPGTAVGRVSRPDGSPIGIDGAKVDLTVVGNSAAGAKLAYLPKPAADGSWSTPLAPGVYHEPRGTVTVPFDGDVYTYDLYPAAEAGDVDSAKGVVGDLHWRTRGPLKRYELKPDAGTHTHWYGACPILQWDNAHEGPDGRKQHKVPEKTTFVFTATPKGKLIDGSEGKPLTWTLGWDALLTSIKPNLLNDIPPAAGGWTITGKEVGPDGAERPLAFRFHTDHGKYQPSVDIKIVADRYGHPSVQPQLMVTRANP